MVDDEEFQELLRRLENIIRAGVIAEIKLDDATCRVKSGQLTTTWLKFFAHRAGNVRSWSPPSIGEQCIVLSPGGDLCAGYVLVGLNSDSKPAPQSSADIDSTTYPDGAVISYDHGASKLTAVLPAAGQADITAPVSVTVHTQLITLDAPLTTTTGALNVQGLFTFLSGMAGFGVGPGGKAAEIEGTLNATENLTAAGIPLVGHHHGSVRSGPDVSGEAIP